MSTNNRFGTWETGRRIHHDSSPGRVIDSRTGARGIFGNGRVRSRPARARQSLGYDRKLRRAPDIGAAGIQDLSADVSEPVRRAAPRPYLKPGAAPPQAF